MDRDALHICAQNIEDIEGRINHGSVQLVRSHDLVAKLIQERIDYITILVPDEAQRTKFMLWMVGHATRLTFNANVDCYTFETFEDYNTVV